MYIASRSTDDINFLMGIPVGSVTTVNFFDMRSGGDTEQRDLTTDDATTTRIVGLVKIGSYVYALCSNGTSDPYLKIWRFAANNLAGGGTLMTFSGTNIGGDATASAECGLYTDGTNLYVSDTGGDTASTLHVFRKYSISGTTLTFVSDITCGSSSSYFGAASIDSSGNFYGNEQAAATFRRYNSSGALQATASYTLGYYAGMWSFNGVVYAAWDQTASNLATFVKLPLQP